MQTPDRPTHHEFVLIGAGFAGLGMAIALRKAGIEDFVILEKSDEVGGVWRDNRYPGAACDVPSHLYSFSFEPNPRWSRVFATQPEILDYLRHCARKYDLARHLRFGCELASARFDDEAGRWHLTLRDGRILSATTLVSGVGQLSRPVTPAIPGLETFAGPSFHSARWDPALELGDRRVAVIGTGASAIQFVPAIAPRVRSLDVFQRSPAYLMTRPDRAYSRLEKAIHAHVPGAMRLHRLWIYAKYESRALAFTRFHGLLKLAVTAPFQRMLRRQVADPALRGRLTPDYPVGCKRILLSNDYLATLVQPHVTLHTEGIDRIVPEGVVTRDGRLHPADVIIHGTGFAATEFLSPMAITGRDGIDLNEAWRRGAAAYLGITVPGFPNFFMLYGPNTNLGHNSIVYMIESQIAHVMRCLRALRRTGAERIEPDERRFGDYNRQLQARLRRSVWIGCHSWYVDADGHNSTNWPGFTLTYRALAHRSSMGAYRLESRLEGLPGVRQAPVQGALESVTAGLLRGLLRATFRSLVGPPFGARWQRAVAMLLSAPMPAASGTLRYPDPLGPVPAQALAPRRGETHANVLYLHGGAFCLGHPRTHRSITSRLAREAGVVVHVPEYRLAPEHPYPAALDDALACYEALLARGIEAGRIVVAGDSAGGALALALLLTLRERGRPLPAAAMLVSPVTDPDLRGSTLQTHGAVDPMVRRAWLAQGLAWYGAPAAALACRPLEADLSGLPPLLIQAGDDEILLSDSTRLAAHAQRCGVPCRLEILQGRWHVHHLQAAYLASSRRSIDDLADYVRQSTRPPIPATRLAQVATQPSLHARPLGAGEG